jgi:tripartite-type tricarboxylate transporter receptor subunit TctC
MQQLPRRRFLQVATGVVASPLISRNAGAQAFPTRPITVVVPTGAGGPQDVVARIVTERMQHALGQPLIIENVAGANGNLGIGRVARANPDGYTIAFSVSFSTHVVNPAIYRLPYDVIHDFEPIALVADNASMVLSKKAFPANDLKELIAWLKANPGRASLGHTGPGSPAHVGAILLQEMTGTQLQLATYRSAGQAMQDLVAGHIDLMFVAPNIALEQVRSGSIKAYAIMGKDRIPAAPSIPTVDEAGLPGFYTSPWYALWAPKDTPRETIGSLSAAVMDALANPEVRKRLNHLGLAIFPRERQIPDALAALQKAEIDKWWPILKKAGTKVE